MAANRGAYAFQDRAGRAGGLDRQRIPSPDILRVRHGIRAHWITVALHVRGVDGAHHPDHRHPARMLVRLQQIMDILRQVHAPADRIPVRPEWRAGALVHDDGAGRGFAIAFVDGPSAAAIGICMASKYPGVTITCSGENQRFPRLHDVALGQDHAVALVAAPGNVVVAPAAVTPGMPRMAASARSIKVLASESFGYSDCGTLVAAVTTPRTSNPGSTCSNWRKLARISPAPASRTNASPTCATTRTCRTRRARRPPVPERLSSRSTSV